MRIGKIEFGALLVIASAAIMVACSGANDNSPTPVPTSTPTPTPTPTPSITINSPTDVASTAAVFVVTASAASASDITFNYVTGDLTALAGTDYTAATGTATILAGATTTTINVSTAVSSAGKTFTMTISAPTNAELGATVTGIATMQVSPAFEVIITTTPETGGTSTTEADCVIPIGAATYGAAVACTNSTGTVTNSVAIPEGRLFYGQLGFEINVGVQSGTPICNRAVFVPYTYLVTNTNATFTAPWEATSTDCTETPTPAACYGGLIADIVSGFPSYWGVYFYPTVLAPSQTWTAHSANSHTYGSNRFSVNNLANRAAAITFTHASVSGDGFIGGSTNFQDYSFLCKDSFDQSVYSFSLTLTDQDITGVYPNTSQGDPTVNQFPDWDPAAWDR